MNLRKTTRDILSKVEQLNGYPVEIVEDPSLSTTALVNVSSRRTVHAHLVRYNPAAGQSPNYLCSAPLNFDAC